MQGLQGTFETHAAEGFQIINVVVENQAGDLPGPEDAAIWQDAFGLTFLVLADVDGQARAAWGPSGALPTTVLVGSDGNILWEGTGGSDEEFGRIEAEVESALSE